VVSSDGKFLFTAGYNSHKIWHLGSGKDKVIEELRDAYHDTVYDAAFSPDGKLLAVTKFGNLMLIDSQSGSLSKNIESDKTLTPSSVHFSYDSKFIITGSWDRIKVIDVATGNEVLGIPKKEFIRVIRAHPGRNEFAVMSDYLQIRN